MSTTQVKQEPVGQVWGDRFEVRDVLGVGGLGVVYEGFDRLLDEPVALKTILDVSPDRLYAFKQEFRVLAEVEHEHLVRLGELFHDGERWFFSMELVRGMHFDEYVWGREKGTRPLRSGDGGFDSRSFFEDSGQTPAGVHPGAPQRTVPLDVERLRAVMRQLVAGLRRVHRAGLVHRDIKPSNIMVSEQGRVVILDFGLVARLKEGLGPGIQNRGAAGTIAYMSPEQALSQRAGPDSDWYSVGVLLYVALGGVFPFVGRGLSIIQQKTREEAPDVRQWAPDAPEDLAALCMDLLARDPQRRPLGAEIARRLGLPTDDDEDALSKWHTTARFVGRQRELAVIDGALKQVADANRDGGPRVLTVVGTAGIGKTALVKHALATTAGDSVLILTGRCYERESVPYNGFDGIVDGLSLFLRGLPRDQIKTMFTGRADLLMRLFPILARVPVLESKGEEKAADVVEERERAIAALIELFEATSAMRPLVLWIEDVQWADRETLDLLGMLLKARRGGRMLLIATIRRDEAARGTAPGLSRLLGAGDERLVSRETVLALEHLAREEAHELLVGHWDKEHALTEDVLERLLGESEGHPLLLQEWMQYLAIEPMALTQPGDFEAMISARLRRLEHLKARLLELVAVAVIPLHEEVAAAVLGASVGAIRRAADSLRTARLIVVEQQEQTRRFEVYHQRVGEALRACLDDATRRTYHGDLAKAYLVERSLLDDLVVLVEHLEASGDVRSAASYALEAGRQAARSFAFSRAAALLARALDHQVFDPDERRAVRIEQGEMIMNTGRTIDAAETFLAVAAELTDPYERRDLQRRAAEALLANGVIEQGLELFEAILRESGVRWSLSRSRLRTSLVWHGLALKWRGLEFVPRDPARISPADRERLELLQTASRQIGYIDPAVGFEFRTRALRMALDLGHRPAIVEGVALQAVAAAARGGPRCSAVTKQFLETARQIAATEAERGVIQACEGNVYLFRADFGRAFEKFEDALARLEAHATGSQRVTGMNRVRIWILKSLFELGDVEALTQMASRVSDDAQRKGDHLRAMSVTRIVGCVDLLRGRPEQLVASLEARPLFAPLTTSSLLHWYDLRTRGELGIYDGSLPERFENLKEEYEIIKRSIFGRRFQLSRVEIRWWWGRVLLANVVASGRDHRREIRSCIADLRAERDLDLADLHADMLEAGLMSLGDDETALTACLDRVTASSRRRSALLYLALAEVARARVDGEEPPVGARTYFAHHRIEDIERVMATYLPGRFART